MKKWVTLLFASLSISAFAQTVYKPFEVDTEAQPTGGRPMLEKFIEANRRIPYSAEVNKIKGTVFISGVVEPDGKLSDVQVTRSLRPDCDREAVRVMRLFNAWQPALKGGQRVRQQMVYMVKFAPVCDHCETGQNSVYYTKTGLYTPDETAAEYRLVTPVDTLGYPTGNASAYKRQRKGWASTRQYSFAKQNFTYHNEDDPTAPELAMAYRLTVSGSLWQYEGSVYSFYDNHSPLSKEQYVDGKRVGEALFYYPTGLVKRLEESLEGGDVREWFWYPNGQLSHVLIRNPMTPFVVRILGQWNSAGEQFVKDGKGHAHFASRQEKEWLYERGGVENGQKNGQWQGRYSDSTVFYREIYDKGQFVSGVTYDQKGDSLIYKEVSSQPEFKGGMNALGQFLGNNIRYPVEASRVGAHGKVFVSFVVTDDGTLDEYKVLQGVGWGLDEEALRVVKMTSGRWTPGVRRGRKVRVKYNMPINFAIQ